ncbi:MAG: hypothetical protein ACOY90_05440 [Candidatus Zhuqueibacterota bacterium]
MSGYSNKATDSMLSWCEKVREDFADLKNELTFGTENMVAIVESNEQNNNSRKRDEGLVPNEQTTVAVNFYLKQANEKLMSVNDMLERQFRETIEYNQVLERELDFVRQELKIEKMIRKSLFNTLEEELAILDEQLTIVYQNEKLSAGHGDCIGKDWRQLFDDTFPTVDREDFESRMRGMEKSVVDIQSAAGVSFQVTIQPIRSSEIELYVLLLMNALPAAEAVSDVSLHLPEKSQLQNLTLSDVAALDTEGKGSVSLKIRTPLNSILTSARIIQKFNRKKPEAVDKFSQIVVDETNRILDLIKDMSEN